MNDDIALRPSVPKTGEKQRFDAIIIGAGSTGLYQLYKLRQLNMTVRLLEAGSGVGGAWFWNRYPGARLDSESYTYAFFFSEELQKEWNWSEEFVGQPELERYFNYVADKFDLRRDMEFNARVESATYDERANLWEVRTKDGRVRQATFLITAVGVLSAPQFPAIPGIEDFKGEWYHTGLWPDKPVDLKGKRVAVLGTGSSGVQIIAAIAGEVASMKVFQRTPNWCKPIHNGPITPERMQEIKRTYRDIYRDCMATSSGHPYGPRQQSAMDVTPEERRRYFDQLWGESGMKFWFKNFRDLATNQASNDAVAQYLAEKIRERVRNPAVAEKLIPKDHGVLMKRPPMETHYYEAYNRENVELIDLGEHPIERFTAKGIKTKDGAYEVDVIVFATGFDAGTGAFNRMEIRGVNGLSLRDHWADGPLTYLGIQIAHFPNLFMAGGPQGVTGNAPRSAEYQVDWITSCISYMQDQNFSRIEASEEAEEQWREHVNAGVAGTLLANANSWSFGSNVPGKKRAFVGYASGLIDYRARCAEAVDDGYRGFVFDAHLAAEQV